MKMFDFIEEHAKANAAFHIACAESLAKEANTLLTVLLAGAGAGFWYVIKLIESGAERWLIAGMGSVVVYLFLLSGLTTWKCLWARPMYPPANEPKNLNRPKHKIEGIRRAELKNRQTCIDLNRDRNDSVGLWLNRCRFLTAGTPLVFAASVLAAYQ